MAYIGGLILALVTFWLTMSGQFTVLHFCLGIISILITLVLVYRLDILDRDTSPYLRVFSFIPFFFWLMGEIVKSNWTVVRACLAADLDISPALVKVRTTSKSDLARVTFANAITLTPGTATIDIDGDKLLIHALYEESALPESFADMDKRSARFADGGKKT